MEKEKYAKLFKAIVGRELTAQEFLQAKSNDFDPKQIKKIAGLTVGLNSDEQAVDDHGNVEATVAGKLKLKLKRHKKLR